METAQLVLSQTVKVTTVVMETACAAGSKPDCLRLGTYTNCRGSGAASDMLNVILLKLESYFITLDYPYLDLGLGDRAFAVAGARVWNSLPATLTSQPSLLMFRRQLKTLLFEQSFS